MLHSYRKSMFFLRTCPFLRLSFLQPSPSPFSPKYSTATSEKRSFTVNYLVNNCGFSPESALKASKQVLFEASERPDSVLNLFRNLGLSESQLHRVTRKAPKLLLFDSTKTILPKLEFLQSKGASSSQLVEMVTANPVFLYRSLESCIIPSYDFVKSFLHSDKITILSIKKCVSLLYDDRMIQNAKFLLEYGVFESGVATIFRRWPRLLKAGRDRFKIAAEEVKEFGIDPSRSAFPLALCAIKELRKSTWEKKVNAYKRWGLSDEDIHKAFALQPSCMFVSENKIERMMGYFVNNMGVESVMLAKNPTLLTLSLERRIIPRASVMEYLRSKGLIKNARVHPFYMTEKTFLQKYVNYFEKESQLLKLYEGKMSVLK